MAFVQGSIASSLINKKQEGFQQGSIAGTLKNTLPTTGFQAGSIAGAPKIRSKDLENSDGLYNLAVQNGLQKEADRILKEQTGEETKKIFSGGFISDVFDVLNAAQYGVTGLIKGKTFKEGVATRQSFSDQDSLGSKGLAGVVGGILLDIAVDPLTYIAPYTILKKIPAVGKAVKAGEAAVFGKKVTKAIEGTEKTYDVLEGGTRVGKYLASKFAWMFGADPIFRQTYERGLKNTAISTKNVVEMIKPISKIDPKLASNIVTKDKTGRFIRTPLEALKGIFSKEDFDNIKIVYDKIDELGKQMVDLGLLGKGKYEENIGEYIKNVYLEYEQANIKKTFGYSSVGVKGIKKRKDLTPEIMEELGQIDNPAYLLFKTAVDMTKDIENAKMFKEIAAKFGTDVAQEGFSQIPKTSKFVTTAGKQADLLTNVKKINTDLKPLLKGLKQTFKADKKALSELSSIEKQIDELSSLRAEEIFNFFAEGQVGTKVSKTPRKLGIIPDKLQPSANAIKKVDTFENFIKSPEGIKLEKLYLDGDLERNGFKSMEEFFDTVKNPYKPEKTGVTQQIIEGNVPKLIKLQKQIEKLTTKSSDISEITKRSIDTSFINLEKNINDLRFTKDDFLEELKDARLGDLAGKYVPNNIKEYLTEIINPSKDTLNKQIVANFKFFKVIMNPATHARNIISNKILNWWKLGMNPLDPRVISSDLTALQEIFKGGGKWTDLATPLGYSLDTFAAAEMKGLLELTEVSRWGKGVSGWKNIKRKLGDIYQAEENTAKLSAFIFNMKKGISPEEAWKAAESATFNYAQVTPFVRKLRESLFGMPFITFSVKSAPVVLETAIKAPQRISVIGKIKNTIENLSDLEETDAERASQPSWVRDGFYIKLPMKDSEDRSAYFDLTYILPFGDLLSGNFFGRNQDLSTGLPESQALAIMKKSPFIQLVSELGRNKDFYGNSIWKNSDSVDKQLADLMRHVTKTYVPPLIGDQLPSGYNEKGERQWRGIYGSMQPKETPDTKRTLQQELLRNVGIKIQPMDADIQETYVEWNKKKALQNLLIENGIGNNFERFYIPKEEE